MSAEFEKVIAGALARGYTTKANEAKTVDPILMNDMLEEIMIILDKELPETVVLAYETFPQGQTVADLLDALIVREGKKWR